MVDAATGRRLSGWTGAWAAVCVLPAWAAGSALADCLASLASSPDGAATAARLCVQAGFLAACALWVVACALEATRTLRSAGSGSRRTGGSAAVLGLWVLLGFLSGTRATPAGVRRGGCTPSTASGTFLVRIDRVEDAAFPRWSGRLWAWLAADGWTSCGALRRPLAVPVEGSARGRPGLYLLAGSCRGTDALSWDPAAPPRVPRISIRRAFLLSEPGRVRIGFGDRIGRVRDRFCARLVRVLGPDAGTLAAFVLLGPQQEVPPEWVDPFRKTGTIHLLSISGFHMTLLGGVIFLLVRIVSRGAAWGKWPALGALGFYCFAVGAPAPALRATCGAIVLAFAPAWGRGRRVWDALGWTGALLPMLDPSLLRTASFPLSMGATAGVFLGGELAQEAVRGRMPRAPGAAVVLLGASVGASVLTLPWCLHHFGVIYPLGVFVNLLAVPAMGLVMVCLIFSAVAIAAGAGAAHPLVCAGRGASEGFFAIVRACAAVTGRAPVTGWMGRIDTIAFTLAAGGALWVLIAAFKHRSIRRRRRARRNGEATAGAGPDRGRKARAQPPHRLRSAAVLCGWCGILSFPYAVGLVRAAAREAPFRRAPLEARFFNVGQGDAVCVRTGTRNWLVDLGPGATAGRDRLVPQLLRAGVRRLDRVWITHGDLDHRGGLADLLASPVRVDTLVIPAGARFADRFWEDLAGSSRRPVLLRAEAPWSRTGAAGGVRLLHPPAGFLPERANDQSFCLLFELAREAEPAHGTPGTTAGRGRTKLLLMGDLEKPREPFAIAAAGGTREPGLTITTLGHHGSRTAGSGPWWTAFRPALAVISVAAANRYGLPHAETLEAARVHGARVLRTDRCGAIRIGLSPGSCTVRVDRPARIP